MIENGKAKTKENPTTHKERDVSCGERKISSLDKVFEELINSFD